MRSPITILAADMAPVLALHPVLASILLGCLVFSSNRGCAAADQPPGPEVSAKVRLPDYKTVRLENGLTLMLMERHSLPLISFSWLLKSGGTICEPVERRGLASLTAQLLRKGTQSRSADQISESLDFVGANFGADASPEYASGSAEFVKRDLDLAVDLVADTLLHPSFPQAELDKMIQQEVDAIKEAKEVPERVIGRYYEAFLFGSNLYGRPVGGTETSLPRITRTAEA